MISEDPSLTGRKYLKYYNKYIPDVQNKTILVKEEDLSPEISTIDKIKAIYPNKIEIVSEDDIIKAIENKAPNTLILHKVGPVGDRNSGYCFKMLIGTDDSNMYYYNQHMIDKCNPNGLLPADLKRLSQIILCSISERVPSFINIELSWKRTKFYQKQKETGQCYVTCLLLPGFFFPFGGIIGPLICWLSKRDESVWVNINGKSSLNFQLSMLLYIVLLFP